MPIQLKSEEEEEAIDEVSPEQEDGESQNQFNNKQSNIQGGQISNIAEDLPTEQIIELLQNAQNQSEMAEANYDENGDLIQQGHLPEEI